MNKIILEAKWKENVWIKSILEDAIIEYCERVIKGRKKELQYIITFHEELKEIYQRIKDDKLEKEICDKLGLYK
jgi:hypothetical protein